MPWNRESRQTLFAEVGRRAREREELRERMPPCFGGFPTSSLGMRACGSVCRGSDHLGCYEETLRRRLPTRSPEIEVVRTKDAQGRTFVRLPEEDK